MALPSIRENVASVVVDTGSSKHTMLQHGATAGRESRVPTNPFRVPPDESIFFMREQEKAAKRASFQEMQARPVCDKTTFASRVASTITPQSKARLLPSAFSRAAGGAGSPSLAEATAPPVRWRRDRERVADFIAKKREIFLVQMSLDIKRAEIRKLEARALQKDEALKRSEELLDADAVRFDQFLRDNEAKVSEAIRNADGEAKRRVERQTDIKRLTVRIATARSELSKQEERLAECDRYRAFLDSITPASHFDVLAARASATRDARLTAWRAECEAFDRRREDAARAVVRAEQELSTARTQQQADRAAEGIRTAAAHLKEAQAASLPPEPQDCAGAGLDGPGHRGDAGAGMFFHEPQQLLDILAAREAENLFLIRNAQEVEEVLDGLESAYRQTQERMNGELSALHATAAHLERVLANESAAVDALQDQMHAGARGAGGLPGCGTVSDGRPRVSLEALTNKVALVYRRAGFDADASASTLQMLTNLEARLEEHLAAIAAVPPDFCEAHERMREKERRQEARDAKARAARKEQEHRLKKALERAAAPVFKRIGKPTMFRSAPERRARAVAADTRNEEDLELEVFLARDML